MRERRLFEAFRYGEYAVPPPDGNNVDVEAVLDFEFPGKGELTNGEPGNELTRRMRSDMGVDLVREPIL